MAILQPYVRFNDKKCREAMTFYQKCFGGKLEFQTVAESPMGKDMDKGAQNNIMHASLRSGKFEIFGSDMMRDKATVGDNIVLSVNCDNEKEIKDLFAKVSKGGEVFMPLEDAFWGALFGVTTDKYGVEWMFNFEKKKVKKTKSKK